MSEGLDVLVVESHPGAGDAAATALEAVGHRVHRCHRPGSDAFPCVGVAEPGQCPVDGALDVALVVRRGIQPRPSEYEQGVGCAIRAGVPLVEDGSDVLDPFAPWLHERVRGDAVAACESAAADDALAAVAETAMGPLLDAALVPRTEVGCRLERTAGRLVIRVRSTRPLDERLRGALGVRAHDAVRRRTRIDYPTVDVEYEVMSAV
jgi:hypothetical protein